MEAERENGSLAPLILNFGNNVVSTITELKCKYSSTNSCQ